MDSGALLFDLDGTLTDSDPFHFAAYAEVARRYGVEIDRETFQRRVSGQTNENIGRALFPQIPAERFRAVADEKEALFRKMIVGRLSPIDGLVDLLHLARQRRWRMAVVSNAPRANIEDMLGELGLRSYFQTIVVGSELAHGKPHPLPYLMALGHLNVAAGCAVAFEDAPPGIASARAAGLSTAGLTTTLTDKEVRLAGADIAIGDYRAPELMALLDRVLSPGASGASAPSA